MPTTASETSPPPYRTATQHDSLFNRLWRVYTLDEAHKVVHFDKISKEANHLAGFLSDVLMIDYTTDTIIQVSPTTHARFIKCGLQLRYNSLSNSRDYTALEITDLSQTLYQPAAELDILPEVIDSFVLRYLKYTKEDGSQYTGYLDETALQPESIAETICMDYAYLSIRVEPLLSWERKISITTGMMHAARKHLPADHLLLDWFERDMALDTDVARDVQKAVAGSCDPGPRKAPEGNVSRLKSLVTRWKT